ncbi:MAG: hypothetical protein A2516_09685 [Alphaproteobacteria bacterium RIFOXYD12_FULL_60_8]|nr:MAG: hypothetical protein A2516_09685 [Alphaproteobacteria bacterium RIFOXYD12_FULL_60_8]
MAELKSYDLSHIRVLILDRQMFMRRLIVDVLRQFGVIEVLQADTVEKGFDMVRNSNPDVIFSDWAPGLDGITFTKKVRLSPDSPNRFVPIVMITAHSDLSRIVRARDAGINEYLRKPITAKLLYTRLCAVIEQHRLYVKAPDFFGPDRRRRRVDLNGPDRRNHSNIHHQDRRRGQRPFPPPERRQGYPGFVPPERRAERVSEPADVVYLG